ncbi:hypothetical protein CPB83DRAFT_623194 [Crepidotus variabilis]|uniref:Uncharacterized protein n=1 Tax=Crepidotus variabilis TaxID=179855 RepID=A0A9P6JUH2_9AGAR|nr:hypothetical protein CPB83DRAFT_623194 [Crepidotus variabilis]
MKHWSVDVGGHSQCATYITEEHKAGFHTRLNEARGLFARELTAGEPSLLGRDVVDPKTNKTLRLGAKGNGTGHVMALYTMCQRTLCTRIRQGMCFRYKDAQAQIDTLIKNYNGTGISWVLINPNRIESPQWFKNVNPATTEVGMKAKHNIGDPSTFKVYILAFNKTNSSLGASSIPPRYISDPNMDGILVDHQWSHATLQYGTYVDT